MSPFDWVYFSLRGFSGKIASLHHSSLITNKEIQQNNTVDYITPSVQDSTIA